MHNWGQNQEPFQFICDPKYGSPISIQTVKCDKAVESFSPRPRKRFHFFHLVLLRGRDDYLSTTRRFEFSWHIYEKTQHLASRSATYQCQSPFVCQLLAVLYIANQNCKGQQPKKNTKKTQNKKKGFDWYIWAHLKLTKYLLLSIIQTGNTSMDNMVFVFVFLFPPRSGVSFVVVADNTL